LKINPFKFSKTIHVLEHIDRLIEIFNVCWPMYAAMPAVLKEAVEKSYEDAGWDLDRSINRYNESLYPTFNDVLINLSSVINNSAFSDELKGNYIGSLVTRVKSLTNGINGRIFSGDELDNEILFNSNTIIDLSRVGAMETKAMIMGIIIMRLQEFRMNEGGMNKELKHVTVLEEAHNIFKRTSTEQSSEGSNLTGKSVEMIANSIAEMRTYGEGFIIADQSPGMIDMSVIRNTNTKIILRLPEYEDRRLVGKAAGLSDEQIEEISKLETGVATVYQNNWIEAVLCKIDKFDTEEIEFIEKEEFKDDDLILKNKLSKILLANHVSERVDYKIDDIIKEVIASKYNSQLKINIIKALNSLEKNELKDVSRIILSLYGNNEAFRKAQNSKNFEEWNKNVLENIDKDIFDLNENYRNAILQCLLREEAQENKELEQFYFDWTDYMRGKIQ
ncbi:ATP-binding protein, partial [Clostridium sp.]